MAMGARPGAAEGAAAAAAGACTGAASGGASGGAAGAGAGAADESIICSCLGTAGSREGVLISLASFFGLEAAILSEATGAAEDGAESMLSMLKKPHS